MHKFFAKAVFLPLQLTILICVQTWILTCSNNVRAVLECKSRLDDLKYPIQKPYFGIYGLKGGKDTESEHSGDYSEPKSVHIKKSKDDSPSKRKTSSGRRTKNSTKLAAGNATRRAYQPKLQPHILFLGQLPYNISKSEISDFFSRKGINRVKLRLLTERGSSRPRGIGFAEFQNVDDVERALKFDRSFLAGRRIRIERTAGGGGTSSTRRAGRIQRSRAMRDDQHRREVMEYVNRSLARAESRRIANAHAATLAADGRLHTSRLPSLPADGSRVGRPVRVDDIDQMLIRYLCSLPTDVMKRAAREIALADLEPAESAGAYLMGVVKRGLRRFEKKAKRRRRRCEDVDLPRVSAQADPAVGDDGGGPGGEGQPRGMLLRHQR